MKLMASVSLITSNTGISSFAELLYKLKTHLSIGFRNGDSGEEEKNVRNKLHDT